MLREPRDLIRRDVGVSEVLGVAVMLVLSVVLAGILFFWFGIGGVTEESPVDVGFETDGRVFGGTVTLVVTSVSSVVNWSEVTMELEGKRITYDHALSGNGKYCVKPPEAESCVDSLNWAPRGTRVTVGQSLVVHDGTLDGKTLRVKHGATNAVLFTFTAPARDF